MSKTPQAVKRAITSLRKEEAEIGQRIDRVRDTIDRLERLTSGTSRRSATSGRTTSRRLSSKGREAISRAAKKRWAAYRKQQKQAR